MANPSAAEYAPPPPTLSSDTLRGYIDTMILALLAEADSYGYQISKDIRERTAERYIMKETTLYSAVNRLEKNGHIRSYAGTSTQGKQRTYYRITGAGTAYLAEKVREWRLTQEVVGAFVGKKP